MGEIVFLMWCLRKKQNEQKGDTGVPSIVLQLSPQGQAYEKLTPAEKLELGYLLYG